MKRSIVAFLFLLCGVFPPARGQGQAAQPDTSHAGMPALELPEITIIGKKAITLPFARKGEIYDVSVYDMPPPDSSFMLTRPRLPLPVGEYNRLQERIPSWHASIGGGGGYTGGSSLYDANGFFGMLTGSWDIDAKGFFFGSNYSPISTWVVPAQSPVVYPLNPISSTITSLMYGIGCVGRTILATDNDLLKSLKLGLGVNIRQEQFPIYGLGGSPANVLAQTERDRSNSVISGGIGSVQRNGFVFDMNLEARLWTVIDKGTSNDLTATAAEPRLTSFLAADIGRFRFSGTLSYESSSLNYTGSTQSPSLLVFSPWMQWQLMERWSIAAGLVSGYGSFSDGGSNSLLLPSAKLRWEIDGMRDFSIWWKPEMHFAGYDSLMRIDPYLNRELILRPERAPINFGAAFSFDSRFMTFTVRGVYRQSTNRPIIVSSSGRMDAAYIDATETSIEANGSLTPFPPVRLFYDALLQSSLPDTGDSQLPMTPAVNISAKGEYDLPHVPVTIYGRARFLSSQNVDLAGTRTIDPYFTFDAGGSITPVSNVVFNLDLLNLTDTRYSWWEGYIASGFQANLSIKFTLQ